MILSFSNCKSMFIYSIFIAQIYDINHPRYILSFFFADSAKTHTFHTEYRLCFFISTMSVSLAYFTF